MSKKVLYVLGILLTIIIGTYFYWKQLQQGYCCDTDTASEIQPDTMRESIPEVAKATSNAFSLNDPDGDFSFESQNNFNFNISSFKYLTPVAEQLNGGIDQLKSYLEANTNKEVAITGLYTSNEENTSAFPTLGLARANTVKNYFTSLGIPSDRLRTSGKLWDDMMPKGNTYQGPISYAIITSNDKTKEYDAVAFAEMEKKIKDNPLVLYFETGGNTIALTAEQRQKIADIAYYLDKKEGATMIVSGHTDSSGSRATNMALGQERADFLKQYFIQNQIPEHKINAISQGPDKPIATNATEEGRAKNRRAEITIN